MEAITEILQFLDLNARIELKSVALDNILGLTASPDGLELLGKVAPMFLLLADISQNDKSEALRKDASLALINLSADKNTAAKMSSMPDAKILVSKLWTSIQNEVYPSADPASMVLSNLTIDKVNCDKIFDALKENQVSMLNIVDRLCQKPRPLGKTDFSNDQ